MADVRLASYADLQNEIQQREAADTATNEKIDTVSEGAAGSIGHLETEIQALKERADSTENAICSLKTDSLKRKIVQNLPSDSVKYTFNDGISRFTDSYRTSCYTTEDGDGYYQSITNSGNSNTYRRAYLSCDEIMKDATMILIEFDTKFGDR